MSSLDLRPFLRLLGWIVSRGPLIRPAIGFFPFRHPNPVVRDSWLKMVPVSPGIAILCRIG